MVFSVALLLLGCLQLANSAPTCGANIQSDITWGSSQTWKTWVWCPRDYAMTGAQKYPAVFFVPGLGEQGHPEAPSKLTLYGPNWSGAIKYNHEYVVNGVTEKLIAISIMPPATYPNPSSIEGVVVALLAAYRIDPDRVYVTGLSAGGWTWLGYVGTAMYGARIAAMVLLSEQDNGPRAGLGNMVIGGGKYWGICGASDGVCQPNQWRDAQICNWYVADSARFQNVPGVPGNGNDCVSNGQGCWGHCCWNDFYNPDWVSSDGLSIYQFMLRQRKNPSPDANGNCPPGYWMNCGGSCVVVPNCHGGKVSCSGTTRAVCDSCPDASFKLCNGACAPALQCIGGTVTCDSTPGSVAASCVCPQGTTICNGVCAPNSPSYCHGGASACGYWTSAKPCTSCTPGYTLCKGKCAPTATGCASGVVCQDSETTVCGTCAAGQMMCGTCQTPPSCGNGFYTCSGSTLTCNCFDGDLFCNGGCQNVQKQCRLGSLVCKNGFQQCTGCVNGEKVCNFECSDPDTCGGSTQATCTNYLSVGQQSCSAGCGAGYTQCAVDRCSPTPNCQGGSIRCEAAYAVCASCGAGYTLCGGVCFAGSTCSGTSPCLATQTYCSGVCMDNVACTSPGAIQCAGGSTVCSCPAGQTACGGVCSTPSTSCTAVCVGTTWTCAGGVSCGVAPANPTGGTFSCTPPVVVGGTCVLTCTGNYVKSGDATCVAGSWTTATCLSPCPALPTTASGTFVCTVPAKSGTTCALTCIAGYTKTGDALCTDGVWSSPTCKAVFSSSAKAFSSSAKAFSSSSTKPFSSSSTKPFSSSSAKAAAVSSSAKPVATPSSTGSAVVAVDGGWTEFGTTCSVTCGGATLLRTCSNPAPANGGANCVGIDWTYCGAVSCSPTAATTTVLLNYDLVANHATHTWIPGFIASVLNEIALLLHLSPSDVGVLSVEQAGEQTAVLVEFHTAGDNPALVDDLHNQINDPNSPVHNGTFTILGLSATASSDSSILPDWAIIVIPAAGGGLILLALLAYCIHKHNVNKQKSATSRMERQIALDTTD